jgi:hypothetical protein
MKYVSENRGLGEASRISWQRIELVLPERTREACKYRWRKLSKNDKAASASKVATSLGPNVAATLSERGSTRDRYRAQSILRKCELPFSYFYDVLYHCFFTFYLFCYLDASLEELIDDYGFDDPAAPHRQSPEAYVAWGRQRSSKFIKTDDPDMPFRGHWGVVDGLIDHAVGVCSKPRARNELVFVHASPGTGKTRVFCELVVMGDELVARQRGRLSEEKF